MFAKIFSWLGALRDAVMHFGDMIWRFINNLGQFILGYLQEIWTVLFDFLLRSVDNVLEFVADRLPDLSNYWTVLNSYTTLKNAIGVANEFVALDFALYLFLVFMSFSLVFFAIKLVLKFIPFIG